MKAIIMAGGEGTRLRPLTCSIPKPMVPVMNRPVLEHIITLLKKHNITDIALTLQYLPEKIIEYFGDGKDFGVNITYFTENSPLGTAGSVKGASSFIDDTFLVISGDALTDIDLSSAFRFHKEKEGAVTIVLSKMTVPLEYGVVVTDQSGKIERFVEKPLWSEVTSNTVNTGIYILEKNILDFIPNNTVFDFARDLFPILMKQKQKLYGFLSDDYWCDIGDLNAYRRCHSDILNNKVNIPLFASEQKKGVFIEDGATIDQGAIIEPPVYIGKNTHIKRGAYVGSYCVFGDNIVLQSGTNIKRSIIHSFSQIGCASQVRGAIIGEKVRIGKGSAVYEQAVVGDESIIEDNCVVKPSIKIWCNKHIESQTSVNANLIWGSQHITRIFNSNGIYGEANTDITPEFLSRLGSAFASMLNGGKIGIACDGSPCSLMLKSALSSGLLSSGAKLYDFGEQVLPITRSAIHFYSLDGGISINCFDENDNKDAAITLINSKGANLKSDEQRKLESIFQHEDFIRLEGNDISEVEYLFEYKLYYLKNLINSTSKKELNFKFLLCCPSPWGQKMLMSAADDLKCNARLYKPLRPIEENKELLRFAKEVSEKNYDFGFICDKLCENVLLVDKSGRIVDRDTYSLLVSLIIMKSYPASTVYVPISISSAVEEMAKEHNCNVIRTKSAPLELMKELTSTDFDSAKMQFIYYFDAVGAIIHLMDFLKSNNTTLEELIDAIPKTHIVKTQVPCPSEKKGEVIKTIIEENDHNNIDMTEGVKIMLDKGWVLVVPDNYQPFCSITSEGVSEEYAKEIALNYVDIINKVK